MKYERADLQRRVRDLIRLMDEIRSLHERLVAAVDRSLSATRAAALEPMHDAESEVRQIAARIQARDGLRRQAARELAEGLGLVGSKERPVAVARIAAALPQIDAERFQDSTKRLRDAVEKARRRVRLTSAACGGILGHLTFVMQAMGRLGSGGSGYSKQGPAPQSTGSVIFEAVA